MVARDSPSLSSSSILQTTPHSPPQSPHDARSRGNGDHANPQPPASAEQASVEQLEPPILPPVPPYSQTATASNEIAVVTVPVDAYESQDGADADIVRYNLAHNGVGGVRRLPEAFPEYAASMRSGAGDPEALPPYGANVPPRYTRVAYSPSDEPKTMARQFFRFGFFCPIFWFFGAWMFFSPTRFVDSKPMKWFSVWPLTLDFSKWCQDHFETEEEKEQYRREFRNVERKWAKRCCLAAFLMVCLCIALGATIFGIVKATPNFVKAPS